MNLLKSILLVAAQYREFRTVYAGLARLSDRALSDMDVTRGDIARVAYAEAERRAAEPARHRAEATATIQPAPVPLPVG